jgi:REP element-mobilizing transposase RayT
MGLDKTIPFPKRPRLKDFDYRGTYAYFVTILTNDRAIYFREAKVIEGIINALNETAISKKFKVLTYCFMRLTIFIYWSREPTIIRT